MKEDIEFQDAFFNRFARLIVTKGKSAHKEYYILHNASIGRGEGNLVLINDSTVSTQHATIELRDGGFWLTDLSSRNGTFINGKKISRARLKPYDRVGLGSAEVIFVQFGDIPVEEVVGDADEPEGQEVAAGATMVLDAHRTKDTATRTLGRLDLYERFLEAVQKTQPGTVSGEKAPGVFSALLGSILEIIPAKRAVLLVREGGALRARAVAGDTGDVPVDQVPLPRSVIRKAEEARAVLLSRSADTDQRLAGGSTVMSLGIKSLLAIPLLHGETVAGCLYLDSLQAPDQFDENHCRDLLAAGRILACALTGTGESAAPAKAPAAGDVTAPIATALFAKRPHKTNAAVLIASVRIVGEAKPDLAAYISMLDLFYKRVQGTVHRYQGEVEWIVGSNMKAVFPLGDARTPSIQPLKSALEIHWECFGLNLRARLGSGIQLATRVGLEVGELTAGAIGSLRQLHPVSMGKAASDASNILGKAESREVLLGPQAIARWGTELVLGRKVAGAASDGPDSGELRALAGLAALTRPVSVTGVTAVDCVPAQIRRFEGAFVSPAVLLPNPQDIFNVVVELPPEEWAPEFEVGEAMQIELDLFPYTGEVSFIGELLETRPVQGPEGRVHVLSLRLQVPSIVSRE